jgi:DNA polymerase-3 subunit alpha
VLPKLREITSEDILTCLEGEEEKKVILGGIVTGYRTTVTKRGEMMASFVLEDLTGTAEVLIFPKVFAQSPRLVNDQIVVVEGRYNIQDDERKIFAQRLLDLDEAALVLSKPSKNRKSQSQGQLKSQGPVQVSQGLSLTQGQGSQDLEGQRQGNQSIKSQGKKLPPSQSPVQGAAQNGVPNNSGNPASCVNKVRVAAAKKLYLRFPYEGSPHLEDVLQILSHYSGPNPVLFYFEENKKLIQTNRELWVNDLEDLVEALSKILGEANVAWKVSQS